MLGGPISGPQTIYEGSLSRRKGRRVFCLDVPFPDSAPALTLQWLSSADGYPPSEFAG